MSIFQRVITKKHITSQSEKIKAAYRLFSAYFQNSAIQENILSSKEEQFQEGFLRELFVKILGYTLNPDANGLSIVLSEENIRNKFPWTYKDVTEKCKNVIPISNKERGLIT
ncbi:MAG: hypothetical protein VB090_01200 [Petrimonas sp.]|nr:hypothetical protein [Petrimonas sp.]